MINYTEDIKVINSFLLFFNTSIKEIDCFQKFMVYKIDDKNVGFIDFSFIYDRIEINYIYVDSDYRKQQIGTKLIEELISFAKINNCINITLEVNENNNVAINFYEKNGFKKSAIRNNYYGNENGILMIRELIK